MGNLIPIASTVLTGSQATVTFSSIPQTYTDLMVRVSLRGTVANAVTTAYLNFNGDSPASGTSYSLTEVRGNGATASSIRASVTSVIDFLLDAANATASTFGSTEIYIPNYKSTVNKPISLNVVQENNLSTAYIRGTAGLYSSSSPITSVDFSLAGGSFDTGSSFYLYGIS